MAGPTAPLVAAATALSALAVLYTTSRNKDSSSSGRATGLAGLSASGTSMHSGLNVRPVSYRRTRETATPDEQSKAAELAVHWAFS
ncbi:hypothetical protein BDZ88DRAFT_448683 [Geranomyces variabilis]|nr:hypothetical protein BDZ88DRAFT_448683 [Geranomyces variabilis]KAJ3135510.1 hypothetical protein HDU90_003913 [Geranomyces variabilis]